jgi:hypothetical protein
MAMHRITLEEKEQITADNADQFKFECSDYFGCPANSAKMEQFIISQVGDFRRDNFYPWTVENFWHAYDALSGELEQRPIPVTAQEIAAEKQRIAEAEAEKQRRQDVVATAEAHRNAVRDRMQQKAQAKEQKLFDSLKTAGNRVGNRPLNPETLEELRKREVASRVKRFNASGRSFAAVLSGRV